MSQDEKTRYDALSASSDDTVFLDESARVFDHHFLERDTQQDGDGLAVFCGWTNRYVQHLAQQYVLLEVLERSDHD